VKVRLNWSSPPRLSTLPDPFERFGEETGPPTVRVRTIPIGKAEQSPGSLRSLWGSPRAVATLLRINMEIDVRDVLPAIRVPTLVLHRTADHIAEGQGRYLAEQIPGATFVEVPGEGHVGSAAEVAPIPDEIERSSTGSGKWAGRLNANRIGSSPPSCSPTSSGRASVRRKSGDEWHVYTVAVD